MIIKKHSNFVYHFVNVFDKTILNSLRKKIISIQKKINQKKISEKEIMAVKRGEMPHSIRLNLRWYSIFKKNKIFLKKILPFSYVMYPPQIRNVKKKLDMVPWHQDRAYMRLLKNKAPKKTLTCFVPLNQNPKNHSSIEFAIHKKKKNLKHQVVGLFDRGIIKKFQKKKRFKLNLGDALVFDDRIIHRTYFKNKKTDNRYSLEFRMTSKDKLTKNKDFFSIEKNKIVRLR